MNTTRVAGSIADARACTLGVDNRRIRAALLGSTALIAAGLAASSALAQTVMPVGGGSITYTQGAASNPAPGISDGVSITGGGGSDITIDNLTINNTSGAPGPDGVRLEGAASVVMTGGNALGTTANGGAALYVDSVSDLVLDLQSSGSFTGSYGVRALAPAGAVTLNSTGQSQTIIANGSALIGIDVIAAQNAEVYFGTSAVSGFTTGVHLAQGASGGHALFSSQGGSINATGVGIQVDAGSGSAAIDSQTAITAPIGIAVAGGGDIAVTTSGAGTIDGGTTGIQAGAALAGHSTTITVGAAIGGTTRPINGVSLVGTGVVGGVNTVNADANISSGSGYAIGSNQINVDLEVNVENGVTVASAGSATLSTGRNITLNNSGTVTNTNVGGAVLSNSQAPST